MSSDEEAQQDEMLALESILIDDNFQMHPGNVRSGQITISPEVPDQFAIAVPFTAFDLDTEEVIGDTSDDAQSKKGMAHVKLPVYNLPPLVLHFTLPSNYPSEAKPNFTLSATWLHRAAISVLCQKLDQLWDVNKGMGILFTWANYLQVDSLADLGITEYYHVYWILKPVHLLQIKDTTGVKMRRGYEDNSATKENQDGKPVMCMLNFNISLNSTETDEERIGEALEDTEAAETNGIKGMGTLDGSLKNSEEPMAGSSSSHQQVGGKSSQRIKNRRASKLKKENVMISIDPRAVLEPYPRNEQEKLDFSRYLLQYNTDQLTEAWLQASYDCEICCTKKTGHFFHRFHCGHMFCKDCVKTGFSGYIVEGDVEQVKCQAYQCKIRPDPHEVKTIVGEELFQRYDDILLRRALEKMHDVTYCPRPKCQRPVLIDSDGNEKCATCSVCNHTFCSICKMAYHGIEPCKFKNVNEKEVYKRFTEGTAEDKKELLKTYGQKQLQLLVDNIRSEECIEKECKPCPHCKAPIEKFEGCNKVTCFKCTAYFCWLCLKQLDKDNPYFHFNNPGSKCYTKLFEGVDIGNGPADAQDWFILAEEEDEDDLNFDEEYDFNDPLRYFPGGFIPSSDDEDEEYVQW